MRRDPTNLLYTIYYILYSIAMMMMMLTMMMAMVIFFTLKQGTSFGSHSESNLYILPLLSAPLRCCLITPSAFATG